MKGNEICTCLSKFNFINLNQDKWHQIAWKYHPANYEGEF